MVHVDRSGSISQSTYLGIHMHPSTAAVSANGGYLAGAGSDSNLALVALVPDVTGCVGDHDWLCRVRLLAEALLRVCG